MASSGFLQKTIAVLIAILPGVNCGRWRTPKPLLADAAYGSYPSQRLDVYVPPARKGVATPLAVLIHGGGWRVGSRADVEPFVAHFLTRGYAVANVEYRLTAEAPAPASVEDVRNALEWVRARCASWNVDPRRMVLAGFSAGAHLALLAALAPSSEVPGPQSHPRAVISFWGVTDVVDLWDGPHGRDFAHTWLQHAAQPVELARRLSPLTYLSTACGPAILAIHSTRDPVVPFTHADQLVLRCKAAGGNAQLIRLTQAVHGPPDDDYAGIFEQVFRFLRNLHFLEPGE